MRPGRAKRVAAASAVVVGEAVTAVAEAAPAVVGVTSNDFCRSLPTLSGGRDRVLRASNRAWVSNLSCRLAQVTLLHLSLPCQIRTYVQFLPKGFTTTARLHRGDEAGWG